MSVRVYPVLNQGRTAAVTEKITKYLAQQYAVEYVEYLDVSAVLFSTPDSVAAMW